MSFIRPSQNVSIVTPYSYGSLIESPWFDYVDFAIPRALDGYGPNVLTGNIVVNAPGYIQFNSGSSLDGYGVNAYFAAGSNLLVDSSTLTLSYTPLYLNSSSLHTDSSSPSIFNGIATFNNNTYFNAPADISSNLSVGGTLGVTGATTLSSTLAVSGNSTISGTLGVTGATTLSTLAVTGDTNLNTLGGDTLIGGALTVGTNFIVDGLSTFQNYIYVLSGGASIVGDSTFTGNLYITGSSNSISCDGNISCGAVGSGSFAFGSSGPDMGAHNGVPIGTPANGSFSLRTDISDYNNQIWQYNSTAGWYNPNAYDIRAYTEVTGNYTILLTDNTIGMNQTAATTITFPASGMEIGRTFTIAVRSASASIGYNGNGNSINPSPSSAQVGGSRSYMWTGSDWQQV